MVWGRPLYGYNKTIIWVRFFSDIIVIALGALISGSPYGSPDITSPRAITMISETTSPDNCLIYVLGTERVKQKSGIGLYKKEEVR